ncbi:MAG: phosphatidate cytidylyltransferase [Burkholderiaceae bacterium]|jgi:phosphatidate cytidylyltransferase|nr:phosphatidate cytidylyltransferase [Pseudomonadota bacterium]MBS0596919.1 phosphatidate cytidylyltransferase [Pseudomonadota bacterium]MCO5115203.1 phosphatidate cytidylyltransferase [Burkholderiaceae bacterium]MCP5219506.1 phosphatidate cytidylyltransferase [Burkholderiaceae bacterium]
MLRTRIITALVLLAILLPALLAASPAPFIGLTLLFIAAAAWEWARLNGVTGAGALATGVLCAALCAGLWGAGVVERPLPGVWTAAGLAWVLGGIWLLGRGVAGWPRLPRALRWLLGLAMLCTAWLALAQARRVGINFLLSALVLVWAADVFAYFAGRALGGRFTGGRKLAPGISPGKSWEGVWGGMLGVLVVGAGWIAYDGAHPEAAPSLYSRLHEFGLAGLVLGVVFLAAMSVVGDLIESLVKRSAGMKDSSQLLPGHGGVLDRIDALLPTLPLAMLAATLVARFA